MTTPARPSLVCWALFAVALVSFCTPHFCTARQPRVLSADAATLTGAQIATTKNAGSESVTYLTGFTNGPERAEFTFPSEGGLFEARVVYRAGGFKGYLLNVNGLSYAASMMASGDEFIPSAPVRILLEKGNNTLRIGGGWGHYDVARIELLPIDLPPPPKAPTGGPSDPKATTEARALWSRLARQYGKITISGVYADEDVNYVRDKTGKTPAILGADLSDYSPSRIEHGAKPAGMDQRWVRQAHTGLILTLCWHWNAPTGLVDVSGNDTSLTSSQRWYMGFNTKATRFDFAAALADENSPEYELLLRDIDAIAVPLQTLADAKVPVLFRPLHEAEGGWFWWGSKGPQAYVKLWRLVHDRLTDKHHLHNLLWVFTAGQDIKWYPGDDVVDVVGVDDYPKDNRDPLVADWQTILTQFGSRKLLTLSEVGFVPDLEFARRHGVYWCYFNTWNGNNGPRNLPVDELKRRFSSSLIGLNTKTSN